ncbi:MAG: family 20 glycosylhydrolase [Clostridia bacterium]|nr:family 20 glycosylhydrolase [Clostridia bacterium]
MTGSNYAVGERIFMLDCARKYYTPEWIKRLIDEISAVGFNAINIHFAEDVAIRLESKKYPWLAGGDHTLCGFGKKYGMPENDGKYITQDEMRDIVRYAQSHGMEVIPSLDTPGHMTYAVKKYSQNCGSDIGNYFHKHGKVAIVQAAGEREESSFALYSSCLDVSNPEAIRFARDLYTEYGEFFRELGCRSFDIGGDELLGWGDAGSIDKSVPKWSNLDHWQEYAQRVTGNPEAVAYDAFIIYMNDISALLRSMGYESIRMWNDDVYRSIDTGWREAAQIDKSIDIQFWSPHTNGGAATAQFYLDRGHNIYNFARLYTYYTLYPDRNPSYVTPEVIMKEWNPYVFAPFNSECTTDNTYIFPPANPGNLVEAPNERIKGAGFCLWSDTPAAETEDEILEHIRPYFTAIAKKASGEF